MKPIPTLFDIQNVISVHGHDEPILKDWVRDEKPKLVETAVAPLFAAIAERDEEIERLRGRLQECYLEAESIWQSSDYEADKSFAATIMGASNIVQRNGTTEPEPAKPETFEAHGETWTRHSPGDPMPVDGETLVCLLLQDQGIKGADNIPAEEATWSTHLPEGNRIIGYRLADEAKPDPHAHLREAFKAGKVIEYNCGSDNEPDWQPIPDPEFGDGPATYRVKPWTLPPPPEGKEWHRLDGWTEEMLPEGWRPLLLGEINTQEDYGRNTSTGEFWLLFKTIPAKAEHTHLRTLRPLPEPEVWVDLGPSDIPPGSVFQRLESQSGCWLSAGAIYPEGIRLASAKGGEYWRFTLFTQLRERYQINRSLSTGKWDPSAWEHCKKLKV